MSEIDPTLPNFKEWLCHLGMYVCVSINFESMYVCMFVFNDFDYFLQLYL